MDCFCARSHILPLGKKTYVMGILNVTPDSFSDGGEFFEASKAVEHALKMQSDGADLIDIGAYSTRPGCAEVSVEEEISRLRPVLEALRGRLSVPVSVDTFRPECVRLALENGAHIINDVGGSFNAELAALAKEYGAGYIVTHNPCGADKAEDYDNGVVAAVRAFFIDCLRQAAEIGLKAEQLCLDPGIGFGKTNDDNLELLGKMQWLKFSSCALLCGASRKRVTSAGGEAREAKDYATVSAHTAAICGGADIIRTHNVPAGVAAARMADAIYRKNGD